MRAVISLVPSGLAGQYHIRKQEGGKVFYAHDIKTKRPAVTYDGRMDEVYQRLEDRGESVACYREYWAPLEPVLQGGAGVSRMGGSSVSHKPSHGGYPSSTYTTAT